MLLYPNSKHTESTMQYCYKCPGCHCRTHTWHANAGATIQIFAVHTVKPDREPALPTQALVQPYLQAEIYIPQKTHFPITSHPPAPDMLNDSHLTPTFLTIATSVSLKYLTRHVFLISFTLFHQLKCIEHDWKTYVTIPGRPLSVSSVPVPTFCLTRPVSRHFLTNNWKTSGLHCNSCAVRATISCFRNCEVCIQYTIFVCGNCNE